MSETDFQRLDHFGCGNRSAEPRQSPEPVWTRRRKGEPAQIQGFFRFLDSIDKALVAAAIVPVTIMVNA
ncbi:hypothetical protein [Saliniramus fredricksonii]|uniref:hypothetical protein n=1 Tax=Saliniramus fredricksonii TaxID=1653334 RepID=UPI001041E42E|nr:hypothetical protein [Saliniramus fredricksonii]